jgi:excisionase family DNA binding protein
VGLSVLTVRDVATHLNVDEKTVYRLAQRGGLPGFKVAGTWRFKKDDIDLWIEERKVDAAKDDAPTRDAASAARSRHGRRTRSGPR